MKNIDDAAADGFYVWCSNTLTKDHEACKESLAIRGAAPAFGERERGGTNAESSATKKPASQVPGMKAPALKQSVMGPLGVSTSGEEQILTKAVKDLVTNENANKGALAQA